MIQEYLMNEARELFPYTQSLRRDFHRHPELGYQETYSSSVIVRELSGMGLVPQTGVAETGVVTMLEGGEPGPVVLLRFDMDALPVEEATGAEYASEFPGRMHACGHDGHMAIGLTVARMLIHHRNQLKGSIKFVFQPAEEGLNGAERMVEQGVMENPSVDAALALHLWNEKPIGWIGASPGPLMAGSAIFDINLTGRGGHGAIPHQAVDPVVTAAQVILGLQTIISRNIPPLEGAVISVTKVHAGEAFNIIPTKVELGGTLRWYADSVKEKLFERFHQVTQGVSATMGCIATVNLQMLTPAVINDPGIAELAGSIIQQMYPDAEIDRQFRTMGSEDFAFMMQKVPGCYLLIGSANDALGLNFSHHHPMFDFDEAVLPRASAILAALAMQVLDRLP